MNCINRLANASPLSASDNLMIFSTANGDQRRASITELAALLATMGQPMVRESAQSFAPSATGFNVTITPVTPGNDKWLRMTPTGALAAGTVTLPLSPIDGQEALVTSTQAVTALGIGLNGATAVNGAPTTIAANGFFKLRYDAVFTSWFRIG